MVHTIKKDKISRKGRGIHEVGKHDFIKQLIEKEKSIAKPSDTWLQNQYPAYPKDRLKPENYLNYKNLEPFVKDVNISEVKRLIRDKPDVPIVILARISEQKRYLKPLILVESDARYYPQYELFASAYHISGFVELFHNQK
jgi:hypothetical protein